MSEKLRFAVVGAGGFARFAVAQFVKREGVQLVGVVDHDEAAIQLVRDAYPDIKAFSTLDQLLADASIGLVYIGSPPCLHYEQSLAALRAGKHVICEKPAALKLEQARALTALAEEKGLLFVVNLMQRYNFLYSAVKKLIDSQVLGSFLHGFFENYASDEFLPADHWFWDEAKSGGIFIEHGVHFFDMFAGWFGEGQVVSAQKLNRPGSSAVWDIAQCTVIYKDNAPVHFYHAFNQPTILDRQEMRLQFERGDVTLFEWVPTRLVLNAVCTNEEVRELKRIFPNAAIECIDFPSTVQMARGRFKPIQFHQKIRLDTGELQTKSQVYEGLVNQMFDDQLKWLENGAWRRKIDATNAVDSVAVAERADQIALRISSTF
ncbi:MAG: Gfo/Idh/MocA family oxidoreductase [Pseudomonadota bacterium]